jgi:hypothetical protein
MASAAFAAVVVSLVAAALVSRAEGAEPLTAIGVPILFARSPSLDESTRGFNDVAERFQPP